MSQTYYIKKWDKVHTDLNNILRVEKPVKPDRPDKTQKAAYETVILRYVKYVGIYQRLVKCHDCMVHPQKKKLIDRCLEGIIGRILELRRELVRVEVDVYTSFASICQDLKICPTELEMRLSRTFAYERAARMHRIENALTYIYSIMPEEEGESSVAKRDVPTVLSVEEAVLLIQRNERLYLAKRHVKKILACKRAQRIKARDRTDVPMTLNEDAVRKIQALWKGYRTRQQLQRWRLENDVFLNMRELPVTNITEVEENTFKTKKINEAKDNAEAYVVDIEVKTEQFLDGPESDQIAETMKENIRQWILECRDITGEFPMFPLEEEGGSEIIYTLKSVEEVQREIEEREEAKKKKKDQKKEKKEKKKKGKKPEVPPGFIMKPSKFLDSPLVEGAIEYTNYWKNKKEEDNMKQTHDVNLMLEDVRKNAETIIRKQVDELMRIELIRLQKAVDRRKPGKPRKAKKKKKKGKKRGGKKKKKLKDLTPGVPIDYLYQELVMEGIVKRVPRVALRDFLGEVNLFSENDLGLGEQKPDLGDIRKMIFDFAILPMSSQTVHESAPFDKSLMIVGPHGSGKKMLVSAICHELGANVFDLSPENIAGKYMGPEGQQMLMHLVMKVGKDMEPSVIFISNCEQMFTKKLPPTVTTKPGRMKAMLKKALKTISPEDRIMLIGTSTRPFKAAIRPMTKMYQRVLTIFPPTHASRYMIWKTLITKNKGILSDDFDLSALTTITRGFTAGDITNSVNEVLTEKRLIRQKKYPLQTREFMFRLATFDPVFIQEMKAFETFHLKTPLAKKKAKLKALEADGKDITKLL